MRKLLLNPRVNHSPLFKKLRQLLVLTTLFLILPQAAWGAIYNSGTLNTTDPSNITWGAWKLSDGAGFSTNGTNNLSFTSSTITLTLPANPPEVIQSISIEIGDGYPNTHLQSAMIGTTNITNLFSDPSQTGGIYTYTPTNPAEWTGNIVITLERTSDPGSILSASVQTPTNYGITIAGTAVTSANKDKVLGDDKVSFTPAATVNDPNILTLNGAALTGSIETNVDLQIKLIGTNSITVSDTNGAIYYNGNGSNPKVTFLASGGGSLQLTNNQGAYYYAAKKVDFEYAWGMVTSNDPTNSTNVLISPGYDLWVGGVRVKEGNKTGVTGSNISSGTISFDSTNKILTLNNAKITDKGIRTGISGLIIDLIGASSVASDSAAIQTSKEAQTLPMTIRSTSSPVGSLLLTPAWTYLAVAGFNITYLNDLAISPSTLNVSEKAYIMKGVYQNIDVGGVPISDANAGDILGNGKVSFNTTTKTLTLNGVENLGSIYTTIDNLTINLKGTNSISATGPTNGIVSEAVTSGTLTITKDATVGGSLEITSGWAVIRGFETLSHSGLYFETKSPYKNETYGYYRTHDLMATDSTGIKWAKISSNETYPIWINEKQATSANVSDITLGGSSTSYASFESTKNELTLNNITINGQIVSTLTSLGVRLIKNNTINPGEGKAPFKYAGETGATAPTLSFISSDAEAGDLTMSGDVTKSNSGADVTLTLGGYGNYTVSTIFDDGNGTNNTGDWQYSTTNSGAHHVYWNYKYQLWVNGVQASLGNASAIKYLSEATAVFDSNTKTLTLDGYTMSTAYNGNAIETEIEGLTVLIKGSCTIKCSGNAFNSTVDNSSLIFETDGAENSSLVITLSSGTSNIFNGFGSYSDNRIIFNEEGLGGLVIDADNYTIRQIPLPVMASAANNIDGGSEISLSRAVNYGVTDIYYSITYSDGVGNVTNEKYTAPFNMSRPGTVTAYLTGSSNYGKSKDAVGKLFGMQQDTYTVAVGEEITPTYVPAIEVSDGITYSLSTTSNYISITTDKISGTNEGVATVNATFTSGATVKTYVLNSSAVEFTVKVGISLSNLFQGTNNYGTYYDASNSYTLPTGMEAYIVTGVSGNQVVLKSLSILLKDTPLLLYKGTATNFTSVLTTETDDASGNKLKYSSDPVSANENIYVLYKDEFVRATGTFNTTKCYLDLSGVAPSRGMYGIGDGSTAIDATLLDHERMNKEEWYDLQGRRIQKPTKPGLYIVNGKKMIINNK